MDRELGDLIDSSFSLSLSPSAYRYVIMNSNDNNNNNNMDSPCPFVPSSSSVLLSEVRLKSPADFYDSRDAEAIRKEKAVTSRYEQVNRIWTFTSETYVERSPGRPCEMAASR